MIFAILLFVPAPSIAQNMEESEKLFFEAFSICATNFPDRKATSKAAKASGFRFENASGITKVYSGNKRRFMVVIGKNQCGFIIDKLSESRAVAISAIAGKKNLKNLIRIKKPAEKGTVAEWSGTTNNTAITLGVSKIRKAGWLKGAVIVLLLRE